MSSWELVEQIMSISEETSQALKNPLLFYSSLILFNVDINE